MSGLMNVELQTTCSALGYLEGDKYIKEDDCIESVKDLIRFVKREDEHCDIRRQLGEAQIVQTDLLPLLKSYKDDNILWETVIRLLVNLTQPAVLCFQGRVPEDKTSRNYYIQIEGHLQAYKEAFADESLFAVLTKKLGDLLQLDWESRQEEDRMLVERILILIRNVLHVPPNTGKEQRTEDDASIHDQLIWALHVSGMEDLLLYLASSDDERQFAFHVLEIVSLMFREQTPEQLTSAGSVRSLSEREKDARELEQVREQEKARKKAQVMKFSTRHSRFGGTYVLANVKSISDRDVIYHKSLSKVNDLSFDDNKRAKKKPKNRKPITEEEMKRRSTLSIRLALKEFCVQFLENCYNPLMLAIKDTLVREKAQENDETYYLWAMRFFMEFQRKHQFRVDTVSETLSVPTFHYIQTNLIRFHEMGETNKKEMKIWSKRMHLALRAYFELLQTLNAMDRSHDEHLRESAKVIKGNVFYMMEYRDVFVVLLRKFNETQQSRAYLRDLIECTHLFLKMLETYCKSNTHLIVQRKKRKGGKRKPKKNNSSSAAEAPTQTPEQLEELWDDVSSELSAIFQGRQDIPDDVAPFDAASEVEVDQQRMEAMGRIQDSLRQQRAGEAVALFRAAREVWPEGGQFGREDISAEEEFMALREVFFAELNRQNTQASQEDGNEEDEENPAEDGYEEEVAEEREAVFNTGEEEFNFKEFVHRFGQPTIVKSYVTLLQDYQKNSVQTTHCVLKMLHRLAYDCKLVGMLYQASLFRVFYKVMNDPITKTAHFKELLQFATHIVRQFFEAAKSNPKIFVELFFWKSVRDSMEIVEGYGSSQARAKAGKVAWTEEEEMEVRRYHEQYMDMPPEERGDGDVADYILENLIDQNKTRRQVLKAMVHLDLIGSAKDLGRKSKGPSRPKDWQEEEVMQLRHLVDEHKDSQDPLANILEGLTVKRGKSRVVEKILELGLVEDKKELYKKRARKDGTFGPSAGSKGRKKRGGSDSESEGETREGDFVDDASVHSDGSQPEAEEEVMSSDSGPSGGDSESDEDVDAPAYIIIIKKLAKKLRAKGSGGAVEWLSSCLKQVAEDREEDGDTEPIPLVPLTEEQENAMEDKTFKVLLKKCGVKQPANEQERFWRIPGHLSPLDLNARVDALKVKTDTQGGGIKDKMKALAKQRRKEQKEKEASRKKKDVGKLQEGARKTKRREESGEKKGKKSRLRASQFALDSDDEQPKATPDSPARSGGDADASPAPSPSPASRPSPTQDSRSSSPVLDSRPNNKHAKRTLDSSSEDSDDEKLVIDFAGKEGKKSAKRARVMESDEEQEDRLHDSAPSSSNKTTQNDSDSDDGDKEPATQAPESFPATLLTQPDDLDSDSDVDDHIPLKRAGGRKAAIQSDSEED